MFNTILFPTDGSPLSDKAAETALAFAQLNKAKLVAIGENGNGCATLMATSLALFNWAKARAVSAALSDNGEPSVGNKMVLNIACSSSDVRQLMDLHQLKP